MASSSSSSSSGDMSANSSKFSVYITGSLESATVFLLVKYI